MLIGGHFPISFGLIHALELTREAGGNVTQFFTKSPGQWKSREIGEEEANSFALAVVHLDIKLLVVHNAYLINLATNKLSLLERSREAFVDEIKRADRLGAKYIVTHVGSHGGAGEQEGLDTLTKSLEKCLEQTRTCNIVILLETMAGQGTQLGHSFFHLGETLRRMGNHPRLGVCLDTCHIYAAGYDISSIDGYKRTIEEFEREIGWDKLKIAHINDAKKPLGSRVDRHEYIGKGFIGIDAFERIVNDPLFSQIPLILETPNPETMHKVYIQMLKKLKRQDNIEDIVKMGIQNG